ncbi:angiotensin-converting enzyme-like [Neocloeon triangulifer]|uniref:angiotensin-converting enzyme-like n=1 Tax=Neocloeon triangulifer TaxID=2078957 RepID=UPI00286F2D66|nr:angiotensin-converting enzyme-like [Neocloeon triangulifer]XP_059473934.1 angiotensin-converting enzyme-like [Neocloeon triangulifer]XP_059473935.1 angiotensin-converting enzyme-like [Neocloeon triangulifer]XP_059473936.1 angiotensin-converting enzyme-like [Neocloeon triangulifer]
MRVLGLQVLLSALAAARVAAQSYNFGLQGEERHISEANEFLRQYEVQSVGACKALVTAQWDYATNVTTRGAEYAAAEQSRFDKFVRSAWRRAESSVHWRALSVSQPRIYRQFLRLGMRARETAGLPDDLAKEMQDVLSEMRDIQSKSHVCPAPGLENAIAVLTGNYNNLYSTPLQRCSLHLDPELVSILKTSRDPVMLAFAWKSWRDVVGPPSRPRFVRLVELSNTAAKRNGFRDVGEQWRSEFDQDLLPGTGPNVMEAAGAAWAQIEPLYRQLHAYVRRKLAQQYGEGVVRPRGPIPAHLLGNMWSQSWAAVEDLVTPFPFKRLPDVSAEMARQGYTPLGLLQVAEQWFTSLGLPSMPADFWRKSIIQKPLDRPVLCGSSAWDFCDGVDYRLKMCATPTYADLVAAHHELAHVQYYMHYAAQPTLFREGANPALHEAVGEMVTLAVTNPDHLQRLGLFPGNNSNDEEIHMNYLMRVALEKLAFVPYSYIIDLWRWKIFSGEFGYKEMNERWWQLRLGIQGVAPPAKRSERDFDAAAKKHVVTHKPYIGYMVSSLLQFQMLQALCRAAGHRGHLHRCELQNRREAGKLLSQVMSSGSSKAWPEVLRELTGGDSALLDPRAMLEFFTPLEQWLRVQNGREGLEPWDLNDPEYALPWSSASAAASSAALSALLSALLLTM